MAASIESRLSNEAIASQAVTSARMAKYANQPANTRRMYIGYQKEWQGGTFSTCIHFVLFTSVGSTQVATVHCNTYWYRGKVVHSCLSSLARRFW